MVATRIQTNLSHFAYVLLLKARYRILKGEREGAMKVLYKLSRLLTQKVLAKDAQEKITLEFYKIQIENYNFCREFAHSFVYMRMRLHLESEIAERQKKEFERAKSEGPGRKISRQNISPFAKPVDQRAHTVVT